MDIEYLHPRSGKVREPLTTKSDRYLQPEDFLPAREITNPHYKANRPGLAFCSSTRALVPCESRLEMMAVLMLDFEGDLAGLSTQPFTLHFRPHRKPTAHTPDFFYRTHAGRGVVVDVKRQDRLHHDSVRAQFQASQEACEQTGWEHRVITEPTRTFQTNLVLLSGYRSAPPAYEDHLTHIYDLLVDEPLPWSALIEQVEDLTGAHPAFIPPLLLHAL